MPGLNALPAELTIASGAMALGSVVEAPPELTAGPPLPHRTQRTTARPIPAETTSIGALHSGARRVWFVRLRWGDHVRLRDTQPSAGSRGRRVRLNLQGHPR